VPLSNGPQNTVGNTKMALDQRCWSRAILVFGGAEGIRTPDPFHAMNLRHAGRRPRTSTWARASPPAPLGIRRNSPPSSSRWSSIHPSWSTPG